MSKGVNTADALVSLRLMAEKLVQAAKQHQHHHHQHHHQQQQQEEGEYRFSND